MERLLFFLCVILGCIYTGTCDSLEDILSFEDPSQECLEISSNQFMKVELQTPIVFYRKSYNSLYVNSRGVISFNKEYVGGYRHVFSRLGIPDTRFNITFLTPLWSFPKAGQACFWQTGNSNIIDKFNDLLETEGSFRDFLPSLLFVVTWKEIQIHSDEPDPHKNATFQVILATDGKISFSQFLYHSIHDETEYLIGFNAGDRTRGLKLADQTGPLSPEQEDIVGVAYRIDGSCVTPLTSPCHYSSFAKSCSPLPNITATCNCSEGFMDLGPDDECEDVNECKEETHNCPKTEMCFNTVGSFSCCPLGYYLDSMTRICKVSPATTDSTTGRTETGSNTAALVSGLVVGFFLLIVIGAILIVVVLVTRRKNRWLLQYGVESHDYIGDMEEIHRPSLHYAGSMIQLVKLPKDLKIPFEDLEFEAKMIGEGEFGTVYRAKYNKEAVAVKILKGISGTFEIRQVVEEIMRMKQFSHPNILSLTGVAIDNHFSPCIVMPFMWNGGLDSFLQKHENTEKFWFPLDSLSLGYEVDTATGKLLEMCHQIAQGMAYLTSEKIVHRDLAARNCMVAFNHVIKVADFGLSVSMGEDKDYFRLSDSGNEKLPVKWMAVESIIDYKFSEATDVWSYGITCWEVFNGGRKPYPDIRNKDILREVLGGYRMGKPLNRACSDSIYTLMRSCWEREPTERPNFTELVSQTSSLLYDMKDYLPLLSAKQDASCNGTSFGSPPVKDHKPNLDNDSKTMK